MTLEQLYTFVSIAAAGIPVSQEARQQLVRFQLIEADTPRLTDRGQMLLAYVLELPLPERVTAWRMPVGVAEARTSAPELRTEDEGIAPPPPPPPTRLPARHIPTDPAELRAEALRMLDGGCGMNETAELLKLTPDQVQAIFYGAS